MDNQVATKTRWAIDPSHSEVQFKVKHLVISTVTGYFKEFNGSFEAGENFENADINFEIKTDSINTNNADRDAHLKSDDFFNAEQFPSITFKGISFEKKSEDEYTLNGDLTIRDNTNPISLNVEFGGIMVDPYGQTKAGFEITGKLNRKDYGLTWGAVTEAGGVVVGDDIKLHVNVQFTKQEA